MVDLKSLETFILVARLSSFRAAATRLNTTQPAVSQRIAGLERTLDVLLFHRTTRRVALTTKGRLLLDYAERIVRIRAEMITAVAEPSARTGTLRLGVAETIVHTWLPKLIERTAQVFPRLGLEIEVATSPDLASRLATRELDLAMMVAPVPRLDLSATDLCSYPVCLVARAMPGLPRGRTDIADLAHHTILTFARNTRPYADIVALFRNAGLPLPRIHASASLATIVRMAHDGLGIAALPEVIVADEVARRRLRRIETAFELPSLTFCAAWREDVRSDVLDTVVTLATEVAAPPAASQRQPVRGRRKAAS